MMKKCCGLHGLAWVLLVIGGLNWGLVGLGQLMGGMGWNVVNMIVGSWPIVESIVYLLVGLSAVALLFGGKCKACQAKSMGGGGMM